MKNGVSGKYTDTQTLFDYGTEYYGYKTIASAGEIISQVEVEHATSDTKNLDLIIEENIDVFGNLSVLESFKPQIQVNENITAPIQANDILGSITYDIDGITYTSNLIAKNDVKANFYFENLLKIVFAIVILIIVYELMYSKKNKKRKNKKDKKTSGKYLYGRVKY